MHDQERQRIKQERVDELRMQQALQKEYEIAQPVDRSSSSLQSSSGKS